MQVRPYPEKDGMRVWLNDEESQMLVDYYSDDLEKQLVVRLLLSMMRKDDLVNNVRTSAIRQLEHEELEAYVVAIGTETKTGEPHYSPISEKTRDHLMMFKQARNAKKDELLFQQSKKTIGRIVKSAAEDLAEQTGDENWNYVRAHDLRRTAANRIYYTLVRSGWASEFALRTVCAWGGWSNKSTFEQHYLSVLPEDMQAEMMEEADLR